MKRLPALAALIAAALATSACVTVIDADSDYTWMSEGRETFAAARDACRERAGHDEGTTAFITCMGERGWSRTVGAK